MKINKLPIALCLSVLFLFLGACAGTHHPANHSTKIDEKQSARPLPPDTSSAELNRIKALEGKWQSTTSMFGEENQKVFTEYKISAAGSAVIETIFPGTPQEMVSVYYDDNHGKLAMTHYCMMRNRPYFSLVESTNDEIKLDVTKVEGLKSMDAPSMGAITLKIKDENNFSSTCESGGKSVQKHDSMTMHFTRVRE